MLLLLSPAKTLDLETPISTKEHTQVQFSEETLELVKKLKKMSRPKLGELMKISPKLADLNYQRYKSWGTTFTEKNARPALATFKGNVYVGLQAETFKKGDYTFAQKHLRILSGLYGIIRPLDLIQPYRLEMGTKWKINAKTANLYHYWGEKPTQAINEQLKKTKSSTVINLASKEYFKVVNSSDITGTIITPTFKENKNGQYKIIAIFAKKMRGVMANYIIKNRIKKAEDILTFSEEGYIYNKDLSSEQEWVFTRN